MKRLFLGLCMLFSMGLCFADVSYNAETKTLTLSNVLTQDEINHINNGDIDWKDAKNLIIEMSSILSQMKFDKLSNIESLILPSDVTEIPNQEFKNCNKLVTVNWGDLVNLKIIGEEAFMETAIGPDFVVPNSVEEIKQGAFRNCYNIKKLTFSAESQIKHIYEYAFYMTTEGKSILSDVYVNVKREIACDKNAFDKTNTCNQTNVGTVKTRLHYPSEYFEHYVGIYKSDLYDENYKDANGNYIKGVITQTIIDQAYNGASNGWQQFFSSGVPIGSESLYRTYSDNVAYEVPNNSALQVFLVYDYDKEKNVAYCIKMVEGDVIPAYTGVIVHSTRVSTVYMKYLKNPSIKTPYNNESYPNNLYHYHGREWYKNYLKPINGSLHIDNVEIVNGEKTYRNYFFNKGTTAASKPGDDWKDEYKAKGWGFFRAVSKDYRVFNKAFLHLPASMTEASSAHIDDSGNLPQDNAQPQNSSKESFTMYILNWEDMIIEPTNLGIATTIESRDIKQDNNYYTLEGLKIENPSKGIYIKNGKKFVIK